MPTKEVSISDSGTGRDGTIEQPSVYDIINAWWRELDRHERRKVWELYHAVLHIARDLDNEDPNE
jgi:hypothetical protein